MSPPCPVAGGAPAAVAFGVPVDAAALPPAALLLAGAVVLLAGRHTGPARRLRRLRPVRRSGTSPWSPQAGTAVAVAAGIAVALLVGGWWGVPVGAATGYLLRRTLRRASSRAERLARSRAADDLPFALDLVAAALSAGAPPSSAAQATADALGGLLGSRLGSVGRALRLGAAPEEAWGQLGRLPGADRFAATAVRGGQSGAALARALHRLADDLRAARLADQETDAHRGGVLLVLPLGLCFLPAFVAGGLAPVVVSMLDTVLP